MSVLPLPEVRSLTCWAHTDPAVTSSIVVPMAEPGADCIPDPRLHFMSVDSSAPISRGAIGSAVGNDGNDFPVVERRASGITVAERHLITVEARPVLVQQRTESGAADAAEAVKALFGARQPIAHDMHPVANVIVRQSLFRQLRGPDIDDGRAEENETDIGHPRLGKTIGIIDPTARRAQTTSVQRRTREGWMHKLG